MEAGLQRVVLDHPHAYGLIWRTNVLAHVWWDQDASRRTALGWYLRDLRVPSKVWRLDVDPSVDELARDRARTADAWLADASRLRSLTVAFALRRAEELVGETLDGPDVQPADGPAVRYQLYVRGLNPEILALAFPTVAISAGDDAHVMHADLSPAALARTQARIRSLGGTVIAVLIDPSADGAE